MTGLSFPRTAKLLKHADFQRVYKNGKRHFAAHLTVFYLPAPEPEAAGPRIGITVGRVLGGAVIRNRIKRRTREAVRSNLPALSTAMDVVINPKKAALDVEFSILQQEIARAFEVVQKTVVRTRAAERSTK